MYHYRLEPGTRGKGLLLCKGQRDMNLIRYYIHMDNAESIFTKPHTFIYLSTMVSIKKGEQTKKKKKKSFLYLFRKVLFLTSFFFFFEIHICR